MGSAHSHASASKAQSPSCRRHVLNGGSLGASASGSLRAHHYHHCHRRMPPTAAGKQASKQARRQPGIVRACVTAYCSESSFASFHLRLSIHFRAGLDFGTASIVVVLAVRARPRDAAHLAVFPSLQTCISAEVRESEYLSTQQHRTSALFFPASSSETTAAHLNPRPPRQDTARRTRLHT